MNITDEELSIINWVKIKLGEPIVKVELTNEMILVCLADALLELNSVPSAVREVTLPASNCIDLSEYNAKTVLKVYLADKLTTSAHMSDDVFSNEMKIVMDPMLNKGTQVAGGLFGGNSLVNSSMNFSSYMTRRFAEISLLSSQMSNMKRSLTFRYYGGKLYLDVGFPHSFSVTIIYSKIPDNIKDITNPNMLKFVKDFTLAYAKLMLGNVRGKFSVNSAPASLDGDYMRSSGESDLERLREQLKSKFSDLRVLQS